jgi:ParB family chromosome partitioning protein
LLELRAEVVQMVDAGELEMGHARALLALPAAAQLAVAKKVASQGLSVRATEELVRRALAAGEAEQDEPRAAQGDPDVRALESRLAETLGARVGIRQGRGGKGRLEIHYNSLDELDGILAHIR